MEDERRYGWLRALATLHTIIGILILTVGALAVLAHLLDRISRAFIGGASIVLAVVIAAILGIITIGVGQAFAARASHPEPGRGRRTAPSAVPAVRLSRCSREDELHELRHTGRRRPADAGAVITRNLEGRAWRASTSGSR